MSMKRIASLTAFLSFFIMLLTSIIMYIAPQGRVANWTEWALWGLSKEQWGAIHTNVGLLFLLSISFHIYFNWQPIVLYLKNKSKQVKVFTKEFNIAMILTLIFIIGTHIGFPPFSTIIDTSEDIRASAAIKYGEPPYGHAETSSLKTFSERMNIELKSAMDLLEEKGYRVDNELQTLSNIAESNNVTPQQIYAAISIAEKTSPSSADIHGIPEMPIPRTGKLTLHEFCVQYNMDLEDVRRALIESNIKYEDDMTIKEIGEANGGISTADIYSRIKSIIEK